MITKSANWNTKKISSLFRRNKINAEITIQRKPNIWNKSKKSLFIQTLLFSGPIPPIYVNLNTNSNTYEIIDGQQRLNSIFQFLKNSLMLSEDTPDVNGIRVAGLRYSELPNEFKNNLQKSIIKVVKFTDLSDEEKEDIFYRLNNGASLKSIESTRVLLGTSNMKIINELSENSFFITKTNVSSNRYADQESILQILMLLKNTKTGFSGKEIKNFAQEIKKNKLNNELIQTFRTILTYLNSGYTEKRKYLRKVHIPSIFYLANIAIKKGIQSTSFVEWIDDFFSNTTENKEYWNACLEGSAKKENVNKRLSYIVNIFEESFQNEQLSKTS